MLNIIFINNQALSYKKNFTYSLFNVCQNSMKSLYKDNKNSKNQLNFNFPANNVKGPLLKKHSLSEIIKLNEDLIIILLYYTTKT